MNKKFSHFLTCLFIVNSLFAQQTAESDRVITPSPTAGSLGKYGDYPVSLFSGQVNIDIPLFKIASGKLTLPVSLSYNSTGNKPSDIPGWVGLGWNLLAGGVITRIIRDLPDDEVGGYYSTRNDIRTALLLEEAGTPNVTFSTEYVNRQRDVKQDIFQFNFDGHTGKFCFDLDGNIRFLANEKFEISKDISNGHLNSFIITTNDGKKYTFDAKEWGYAGSSIPGMGKFVSSWYLTKIEDLNGDQIVLNYTIASNKYRFKEFTVEKNLYVNDEVNEVYTNTSHSMDEVIYLDEIVFSEGKLKFNTSIRNDLLYRPSYWAERIAEEKKLDNIVLTNTEGAVQKTWRFSYIENPNTRLKLQILREVGTNNIEGEPYVFQYNQEELPGGGVIGGNPYSSNSVDYWGYYNAARNIDGRTPFMYLPNATFSVGRAERSVNPGVIRAEMLEKITYPLKGYTIFEYEPNDYSYSAKGPGLLPAPQFKYVWEQLGFFYESGVFEENPNLITFTLDEVTDVFIHKSSVNVGPNKAWCPEGAQDDYFTMQPGTYTLAQALGAALLTSNASSDIQTAEAWIRLRRKEPIVNAMGGGVRIKSVRSYDGSKFSARRFEYRLENDQTKSSGILSSIIINGVYLQDYWLVSGYWLSSESIYPTSEGPPVCYTHVKELFDDGSTITHNYLFMNDEEGLAFHIWQHDLMPYTSSNYWRGLETKTRFLNADKVVVKEIINDYDIDESSMYDIPVLDYRVVLVKPAQYDGNPFDSKSYAMLASKYFIPCRFVFLKNKKEVNYDIEGHSPNLINETITCYENSEHLQPTKIKTFNSKKQIVEKVFHYPAEMIRDGKDPDGVYQRMVNKNLITLPIEEVDYVNGNQISLTRTSYFEPHTEVFVPKLVEKQQFVTDPVQLRHKYVQYDSKGNILEQAKANDASVCYLWGYGNKYPVAEVKNASYNAVVAILNQSVLQSPANDEALRIELNKIRLNFPSALAKTYTFKPLIGMTSETDVTGRTTYYEYDAFSRLSVVKDHEGNIIKTIDYKIKQ